MTEARLYKKLENDRVQCRLCSQFCLVEDGARGLCGVRENKGGTLYTLVYDHVAAVNMDPVEKKPLYHFLPGTMTFSFGTQGCNFSCSFCQNDSLSQAPKSGRRPTGHPATPEGLVRAALDNDAASISYTYSEPTIFYELVADTAALAHEHGLRNILVSNGFQSPECLDSLAIWWTRPTSTSRPSPTSSTRSSAGPSWTRCSRTCATSAAWAGGWR